MHYVPNTTATEKEILDAIGVKSFTDLLANVPAEILQECRIRLPEALSETELVKHMTTLAAKNLNTAETTSFLGGGAYDHFIPAAVDFLIGRSEFYTAYTPYQPEVSQGTLQSIYEFQSLICQLFDMEVSNASMYDGATALAEAAIMASGITRRDSVLVSPLIHPATRQVLETYLGNRQIEMRRLPEKNGLTDMSVLPEMLDDGVAAVLLQSPNFLGSIEDAGGLAEKIAANGSLFILSVDPISAAILKSPGELGADIAVAEGQPLGLHQAWGGPYLGIFTAQKKLIRKMPGRVVGETEDVDGKRGYVLVLQTREQHIRRERATSNICTNQGLMALAATIYLALMGKNGLQKAAQLCLHNSHELARRIAELPGFELAFPEVPFFKEFAVKTPMAPAEIVRRANTAGFFAGLALGDYRPEWKDFLLIAVTEKRTAQEIDQFVSFLAKL